MDWMTLGWMTFKRSLPPKTILLILVPWPDISMIWPTKKNAKNAFSFSQAAGIAEMQVVLAVVSTFVMHSPLQVYLQLNLPTSEELLVWELCFRSIPGTSSGSFF